MSIKISELPSADAVNISDYIPIVQSGTTKKATAGQLKGGNANTISSTSTNDEAAGAKAVYDYAAPKSHASTSQTYGVGTTTNYGHVMIVDDLTTSTNVAGKALSAHQGKVLDDKIAEKEDIINADNKIDADFVDDTNSDNKFMTAEEKEELTTTIEKLQAENKALYDQLPTDTTTMTDFIHVEDSSNLPTISKVLGGNATQADTPNPEAPQDIHVVTGDNVVKVVGKNLFKIKDPNYTGQQARTYYGGTNYTKYENGYSINSAFTAIAFTFNNLVIGEYYTISFDVTGTKGEDTDTAVINNYNSGGTNQFRYAYTPTSTPQRISYTFQCLQQENRIGWSGGTQTISNIQLERNSSATSFEPYTSQSITLPLGNIELAKIGDYTDKLFKAIEGDSVYDSLDSTTKGTLTSGAWYKQGNIKKVTFTGASEEGWYKLNNCFTITNSIISDIIKSNASKVFIICDQYNGITTRYRDSVIDLSICKTITGSSDVQISIKNTAYSTATEFSASLVNSPITVYYVINTPTYTQITDTTLIGQLEQWRNTPTYKNVTNSWVEPSGTNAQASQQWHYIQDLVTYIQNNA